MTKSKSGRKNGSKVSDETKKRISKTMTGGIKSMAIKQKISDAVNRLVPAVTGAPILLIMVTDLSKCRTQDRDGYTNVYIPNPIPGQRHYCMRLHVALMEQKLGRKLVGKEQVHHWGEKNDNRLMFLSLTKNKKEHMRFDRAKVNLWRVIGKYRQEDSE